MHGQYVHIQARIETLENLSGHADYGEILGWLRKFHKPPGKTFLVHGEPKAAESLRQKVAQELQWDVSVGSYLQKVQL
jgi:metallo-beta-lactamase family protein